MKTVAVAANGGAYSNYLKWLLYYLLFDDGEIIVPWRDNGTSHALKYINPATKVKKYHLDLNNILDYNQYSLVSIHPVTGANQSFVKNCELIQQHIPSTLVLYPAKSDYLWTVNNSIYKVFGNQWANVYNQTNISNFTNGWGYSSIDSAPAWAQREFFSYNLFPAFESQYEWFAPDHAAHLNYVFISDLFYNFDCTIERIQQKLDVNWIRDPKELSNFNNQNLLNQPYNTQDHLVNKIINSVHGKSIVWSKSDLTIISEAFIQKSLRDQGIMLQCTDLNDFPTSTEKLIEVFE